MSVLAVTVGGALGAAARWLLDQAIAARNPTAFPLGTLLVNVTGSLALGALVGLHTAGRLPDAALLWAGTGFLGAYTTFSTFTYETLGLIEDGAWRHAAANLLLSGPLSFAAALAAFLVTR